MKPKYRNSASERWNKALLLSAFNCGDLSRDDPHDSFSIVVTLLANDGIERQPQIVYVDQISRLQIQLIEDGDWWLSWRKCALWQIVSSLSKAHQLQT